MFKKPFESAQQFHYETSIGGQYEL